MTNEEKAREILSCPKCPFRTDRPHKIDIGEDACAVCFDYESVMAMAKWKDEQLKEQRRIIRNHWQEWAEEQKQQLIDKACEWLEDNAINYVGKDGITAWRSVYADFRKAMEGGGNE